MPVKIDPKTLAKTAQLRGKTIEIFWPENPDPLFWNRCTDAQGTVYLYHAPNKKSGDELSEAWLMKIALAFKFMLDPETAPELEAARAEARETGDAAKFRREWHRMEDELSTPADRAVAEAATKAAKEWQTSGDTFALKSSLLNIGRTANEIAFIEANDSAS